MRNVARHRRNGAAAPTSPRPIGYVLVGFFALLFGCFFYVPLVVTSSEQSMQAGMDPAAVAQHQPDADRPDVR